MVRISRLPLMLKCLAIGCAISTSLVYGQKPPKGITNTVVLPHTSIKNQFKTSTCWSFCTLAILESEQLLTRTSSIELSPMYIVYYTYLGKVEQYLRFHGAISLSGGGQMGDVTDCITNNGIVPQSIYKGITGTDSLPSHGALDEEIAHLADSLVKLDTLPDNYLSLLTAILDNHLGVPPSNFVFNNKTYTPKSFANSLPIHTDQYLWLVSVEHHPKHQWIIPELPDNWALSRACNLPLDAFVATLDTAITRGYTIAAAVDMSEPGFLWQAGIARLSAQANNNFTDSVICNLPIAGTDPMASPHERQKGFDNYTTTDDHGMEIVGLARSDAGEKYYIAKNSWGANNCTGGYIYLSEGYMRTKLVSTFMHRQALPSGLLGKISDVF